MLVLLGERIRHLRLERKFTQEQFSERAGIDRAYFGGIERGERNVAAINIVKIANALGVDAGNLFPPTSEIREVLKGKPRRH